MKRSPLAEACAVLLAAWVVSGSTCTQSNAQHPETLRHQVACKDYIEKRDLDAAESRCKLCLEYDRPNPECLNGMGLIWYLRAQYSEARDYYKRAIRSRNDFPEARNNLGVLFLEQDQDYDEAITMFSSAIKIDPGYRDARYNLAYTHMLVGNIEHIGAQKRILAKGKNDVNPAVLKSEFGKAEKSYEKADEQLRRLFELDPKNFRAYAVMAYIEFQRSAYAPTENRRKENLQKCQSMGMRCIELAPTDVNEAKQCRGNVAASYEALANFELAMSYYQGCLAIDTKDPECLAGFNRAYAGFATKAGGLKKYVEQVAANPGYAAGHFNLCVGAFEMNLPDIAAASCENALQLDKDICLAHYHLGKHYRNVLNQAKAIGHCKDFISCAGTQNPAEIQECKDLVSTLEVQ